MKNEQATLSSEQFEKHPTLLWSNKIGGWTSIAQNVLISQDGSFIIAGCNDGKIYFFNREGKLLWNYKIASWLGGINNISISQDGSYIAAGSTNGKIYFFNREGKLLWNYKSDWMASMRSVSVSRDGTHIAAGSSDFSIYFFNRDGELLWSHKTDNSVEDVSVSQDGLYITAGSGDKKFYFFDQQGKLLWSYKTDNTVEGVSISQDGSYTALRSKDKNIYFFNRDGEMLWSFEISNQIQIISISHDGLYLAAGSKDNKIYFFDCTGKLMWSYETGNTVNDISISEDNYCIVAGSKDNKIYSFDCQGDLLWSNETGSEVNGISISPDSKYVAAVNFQGNVFLYKNEAETVDKNTYKHSTLLWDYDTGSPVKAVSVSSDGTYIAAGSGKKTYLLNHQGKLLWSHKIGGFLSNVQSVSVSSDGAYIAAGSDSNLVNFFNQEGKQLWSYKTGGWVSSVSVSSDGTYIAAGSGENKIYLFNRKGELLMDYQTGGIVRGISISPDGIYIAAGSGKTVYFINKEGKLLWDHNTGSFVKAVSVSSDGIYIAAGSGKKTYFFNQEGKLLWTDKTGGGGVSISSDGSYLAAGSNKIHFFNREGKLLWSYSAGWNVWDLSVSRDDSFFAAGSKDNNISFLKLDFGIIAFNNFKKLIEDAEKLKLIIPDITNIEEAYEKGDHTGINQEFEKLKPVISSFKDSSSALQSFESQDLVSGSAQRLYTNAQNAFNTGLFRNAFELSEKAKMEIETTSKKAFEAREALNKAQESLGSLKLNKELTTVVKDIYSSAEEAYIAGRYSDVKDKISEAQNIRQIGPTCKKTINELKKLIGDAETLELKFPDITYIEKAYDKGEYDRAIDEAKKLLHDLSLEISKAKPEILLEPEITNFKLNTGTKIKILLQNKSNIPAISIELNILYDELVDKDYLTFRILSGIERLDQGKPGTIEVWHKFTEEGDLPLIFLLRYKDTLGREYEKKQMVWVHISSEIPYQEVMDTAQIISHPGHISSFPPELEKFYQKPEYVGRGGFGVVFKAKRKSDGLWVAVKVPISMDASTGKTFVKEITAWQNLKHENIVELYDLNVLPIPYLELEYMENKNLQELKKPVEVEAATQMIFEIAQGLRYAHSKGVIHRDLKPQNVLLTRDLTPKIIDWGLSKIMIDSKTSSEYGFSPLYATPEQISPKKFGIPDERTDIYQLGMIFYELATGKPPFKGEDFSEIGFAIINDEPELPSAINPEFGQFDDIILRCLKKQPDDRYRSIDEFQHELADVLKLEYTRSLERSVGDLKRSCIYCGDLVLLHARIGDVEDALKYAVDMMNYTKKEFKEDLEDIVKQLDYLAGRKQQIGDELMTRIKVILHQLKMGR
jgi:serine/threonine protein kinase/WD40 repeat protein